MKSAIQFRRILVWLGLILLQLFMTQIFTLALSFLLPDIESMQQSRPALFAVFLGFSFSLGVFLPGWLAIKLGRLATRYKYTSRLTWTIIGVYIPLLLALFLYGSLLPGNPFFFVSILVGIVGFHLPGLLPITPKPAGSPASAHGN